MEFISALKETGFLGKDDQPNLDKAKKAKKIGAWIVIFLTIHGLAGFALFISEEAAQAAMFGAFSYSTAKDWEGLKYQIEIMQGAQNTMTFMVYSIGWFAPIMQPAYIQYVKSNQAYIDSQKARVALELGN